MTPVQATALALELGLAALQVIEAARRVGCLTCDVELEPADAPDLRGRALDDRLELDRIATGTDRQAMDARLDADEVLVRGIGGRVVGTVRHQVHLLNRGGARCGEEGGLLTEDVTQMTCPRCAQARAQETYGDG
jgi:hypothetical protein